MAAWFSRPSCPQGLEWIVASDRRGISCSRRWRASSAMACARPGERSASEMTSASARSSWPTQRIGPPRRTPRRAVLDRPLDSLDESRVDAVHQTSVDVASRVLEHDEDRRGDEEADEGVGDLESGGHADGADDDGQGREPVGAGVQPVGHQGGGPDLAPDADAVDGDELVARAPMIPAAMTQPTLRTFWGCSSRLTASHAATADDRAIIATMKIRPGPRPGRSRRCSAVAGRRPNQKARPRGRAVRASAKLWIVSESSATEPLRTRPSWSHRGHAYRRPTGRRCGARRTVRNDQGDPRSSGPRFRIAPPRSPSTACGFRQPDPPRADPVLPPWPRGLVDWLVGVVEEQPPPPARRDHGQRRLRARTDHHPGIRGRQLSGSPTPPSRRPSDGDRQARWRGASASRGPVIGHECPRTLTPESWCSP